MRVTLNLPFVRHRLGRSPLVDVLLDIEQESGIDISLKSTECILNGGWQQIVRAKESIEKRFASTTIVRGSDTSSELSEDPRTASTAQYVGGSGLLSGMVESEDVPCEIGAEVSPENTEVNRKECSTSPDEHTEAPTENNKQPDKADGRAYANEAIPVDVNIWQYIERICGDQLDAIERDCGVTLKADEHGDVLMVTISDNDKGRDSVARWRFIELHSDVMSRVVVEICEPLSQLYGTVKLKAACKRVQDAFRDNVLVKAERGRYIFIGEVDVAKKARRRFMEWAQIAQASWKTTNQRHHGNQVSPNQTTPRHDISLESPKDKTTEPSAPDSSQKHVDNSRDIDASQPHRPDREISMPLSNKRIVFEFQDQPSRGSELGRVQKTVFNIVPAEPQAGTLSKLDNSPTTLHTVDVLPPIDPAYHHESRETQRLCEQDGNRARTAMTVDHADNNDTSRCAVSRNESETHGTKVDVSNIRNELLGSEHMPDLEPISSDEEFASCSHGVNMVDKECVCRYISGDDRLPENTVEMCTDETHNDDVGLENSAIIKPFMNEVVLNKPVETNADPLSASNACIPTEEKECIAAPGKESKYLQQTPPRQYPNGNERIGFASPEEGLEHHEIMRSTAPSIRDLYSSYKWLGDLGKRSSAATSDDISPCYPDTCTRQDMIQHLLTKNDPRLTPQLQKLMTIPDGIDVSDLSMKGLRMSHGSSVRNDNGTATAGSNNHSRERARNVGLYEERHLDDPLPCKTWDNPGEVKLKIAGCFMRHNVYTSSVAAPERLPDTLKASVKSTPDDRDMSAIVALKQPAGGTVSKLIDDKTDLPGYQQVGVILVTYDFPSGILKVCIDGTCLI